MASRRKAPSPPPIAASLGDCEGCHDDIHAGQFQQSQPEKTCKSCHSPETFDIAKTFDHNSTRYPLEGKHVPLACEQCHNVENLRNGMTAVRWRLGYTKCKDCHANPHQEGTCCAASSRLLCSPSSSRSPRRPAWLDRTIIDRVEETPHTDKPDASDRIGLGGKRPGRRERRLRQQRSGLGGGHHSPGSDPASAVECANACPTTRRATAQHGDVRCAWRDTDPSPRAAHARARRNATHDDHASSREGARWVRR